MISNFAITLLASNLATGDPASYLCNYARVTRSSPALHDPHAHSGRVARLRAGSVVYVCDERGVWLNVFFSGQRGPCGPQFKDGLDVMKAKSCRSGWVTEANVEVLSG